MDTNAEILIELSHLRGLSTAFSGGDRIHRSHASTLDAIAETISFSSNILYDITSYRERKRQEYADGLDYNAIKKIKITKEHIFSLFRDPRMREIPNANSHISLSSGAHINDLLITGWTDGIWFLICHDITRGISPCISFERCMHSSCWVNT